MFPFFVELHLLLVISKTEAKKIDFISSVVDRHRFDADPIRLYIVLPIKPGSGSNAKFNAYWKIGNKTFDSYSSSS